MGGGNDNVNLANGSNSVSVDQRREPQRQRLLELAALKRRADDAERRQRSVPSTSACGVNTLNLAAGANSFANIYGVDTVHGSATDDTLIVANGLYASSNDLSVDLGAGNDTLQDGTSVFQRRPP